MQRRRLGGLIALVVALAGCSVGIVQLNGQPTKYYEQSVSFVARVSRVQALPGETLLELADAQEHRIFARAEGSVDVEPDDWVKVTGTLVPEARIGGKIVYDVVQVESVSETRAPFLRNLF
jgi:hypothetical protein